jgi:hypothetical protein
MKTSKYYNNTHFARANPTCTMQDMSQELLDRLDVSTDFIRENFDKNYLHDISSAGRTVEHERSRGRTGTSSHVIRPHGSDAVDIRNRGDSRLRYWIMAGLLHAGFDRIGINFAQNFYHVDCSKTHEKEVLFTY